MSNAESVFLKLAPNCHDDPFYSTVDVLIGVSAEKAIRSGTPEWETRCCGGSLHFVGNDVRDRVNGILARLSDDELHGLEQYPQDRYATLEGHP